MFQMIFETPLLLKKLPEEVTGPLQALCKYIARIPRD